MCPLLAVFFAGLAALSLAAPVEAQQPADANTNVTGISVQASPQVFATMCALGAAGYQVDESLLAQMPARRALRADLLKMQGPASDALRQFYQDHALADPGDTLSRYMTFAIVAGPPPDFNLPQNQELLPPDVVALDGFQEVLANFYREARLDSRWTWVEPEYEPALESYRASLRQIVTVSDAYLREIVKPNGGRTFTVYVEPLVGARTNFRNYGDQYSMVVGTTADIPVDAIQHAYLHFVLDPLVLRNRPLIYKKRALLAVAARAPRLPLEYDNDFISFVDECLIKAVELRLRHLSGASLEATLRDEDQSGFILVRPLVAQLQLFEKAGPAMSYYFGDLMSGIDVDAEQKRLQGFAFPAADSGSAAQQHENSEPVLASELDRSLAEGNRELGQKDVSAAADTFERILAKYPDDTRAMYGLAIASVVSGHGDQAKQLFERITSGTNSDAESASVDPQILAWSHVYLGRIADLQDQRDLAVGEYRAALAVDDGPADARAAAQSGVDAAYKAPAHHPDDGSEEPSR
ncbi:MAG TPA: tetratricopeptide repeat protein [Candidatus Acidoferrales bacterium]|nr:tetratricopeptide repeat protein [Candidatus Acidoferrales bacterium]